MAKGLKEIMEPPTQHQWTLQEELLLAHAVVRFGLEDWKTVSESLRFQAHNFGRSDFSPEVCQAQFNLLHTRCGIQAADPDGVVGSISKMLKEQRLSELRSGLSRREDAISLLKAKISNLEQERLRLHASTKQTETQNKRSTLQLNYDPPADHQANGQIEKAGVQMLDSPSTPALSLWGEGVILMPTLSQEMASWLASGDAPLLTDEAEVLDASPQGTSEALKGGAAKALKAPPLAESEALNASPQGTSEALKGGASKALNASPLEASEAPNAFPQGTSEALEGGASEALNATPLGASEALNASPQETSEALKGGASEALNASLLEVPETRKASPQGASKSLKASPEGAAKALNAPPLEAAEALKGGPSEASSASPLEASEASKAPPQGASVLDTEGQPSGLNVDVEEHLIPSGGEPTHQEGVVQLGDVSKDDVSPIITPTSLLEAHALDAREDHAETRGENERAVTLNEASSEEDVPIANFKKSLPEAKTRVESPRQEESALDALAEIYSAEETQPEAHRVDSPTKEDEPPKVSEETPVERSLQEQASAEEPAKETAKEQERPVIPSEVGAEGPEEDASKLEGPETIGKSSSETAVQSALPEPLLTTVQQSKENQGEEGTLLPEKQEDSQEHLTLPETAQAEEAVEGAASVKAGEEDAVETQDASTKGTEGAAEKEGGEFQEVAESEEKQSEAPESKPKHQETESKDLEHSEHADGVNDKYPERLPPLNERPSSSEETREANLPEERPQIAEGTAGQETEQQKGEPQAKEEVVTVALESSSPEAKIEAVGNGTQAKDKDFKQPDGVGIEEGVAVREESEKGALQEGVAGGGAPARLENSIEEHLEKGAEVEKAADERGESPKGEGALATEREAASAEAREAHPVEENRAEKEVPKLQEEGSLGDAGVIGEELERRQTEVEVAADSEAAQETEELQVGGEAIGEPERLEAGSAPDQQGLAEETTEGEVDNQQGSRAGLNEPKVNDRQGLAAGLREPASEEQSLEAPARDQRDLEPLPSSNPDAAAYRNGLRFGLAEEALKQQGLTAAGQEEGLTALKLPLETEDQSPEEIEANQSHEESVQEPTVDQTGVDASEVQVRVPQGGLDLNLRASDEVSAPEGDVSKPVIDLNMEPQEGPVTSVDGLAVLEDGSLLDQKGTLEGEFAHEKNQTERPQIAEETADGKGNESCQKETRKEIEKEADGKETEARNESDGPMHSAQDSLLGGGDVSHDITSPSGVESKAAVKEEVPHMGEKQATEVTSEGDQERVEKASLESGIEGRSADVDKVGQEESVKQKTEERSASEKDDVRKMEGEEEKADGAAGIKRRGEENVEKQASKRAKIENGEIGVAGDVSEQKEGVPKEEEKSEAETKSDGEESDVIFEGEEKSSTPKAKVLKGTALARAVKAQRAADRKEPEGGAAEEPESGGGESDTQEEEGGVKKRPESAGGGKKKRANTAPARAALAAKLLKQAQLRAAAKEKARQESPDDVSVADDDVSIAAGDVGNQDPPSPPVEYDEDLTGGSEDVEGGEAEMGGSSKTEEDSAGVGKKEEASWQRKHLKIDTQDGQSEGESSPAGGGSKSATRRGGSRPQPGGVMALCKEVVLNLSAHRAGHLFRDIDYTTFPGNERIERQVDLHIIRQNVDTGVYDAEGSKGFYRDIQTMVDNVTSSFEPGTNEHVAALALRTFADEEMALVWKTEEMIRDGARSSRRPPPKFEPIITSARKSPLGREESPFSAAEETGKNPRGKSRLGSTPDGGESKKGGKGKNATPKGEEPKSKAASKAKAEKETPRNESKSKAAKPSPKTEPKPASKSNNKQKAAPKSEPPKKSGASKEKGKGVKRPPEPSPEPEKKKSGKKARR